MTSRLGLNVLRSFLRSPKATPSLAAPLLRPYPRLPRTIQPTQTALRYQHSIPRPPRPTETAVRQRKLIEPHYELTFTCVPCGTRSKHIVSKQAYHKGSCLITCPSCRNRHVISDHLKIFGDRNITVEDLMRERGRLVKRGTLGEDGDVEFWEDGTVTERDKDSAEATEGVDEVGAREIGSSTQPSIGTSSPHATSGARPKATGSSAPGASFAPSTRRHFSSRPFSGQVLGIK